MNARARPLVTQVKTSCSDPISIPLARARSIASLTRSGMLNAIAAMMRTRFVMLLFKAIPALVSGFFLLPWRAAATDWPQFRGPHRDGTWDETGILESFPRKGLKICWRHPVGGGFSSPVVAEG